MINIEQDIQDMFSKSLQSFYLDFEKAWYSTIETDVFGPETDES